MRDVEPPREQLHERRARRRGHRRRPVDPDQRDADRAGVEPLRVRADDVPLDPAEPALEHLAVLVDEEVVAEVVPAVPLHVVGLDPADDGRRLLSRIRVDAGGVVDDRERQRGGVRRGGAADQLVRLPLRPRSRSPARPPARASGAARPRAGSRHTRRERVRRGPPCAPRADSRLRSSTGCRAASPGVSAPGRSGPAGPPPRARRGATRSSGRRRSACGTATVPGPCQCRPTRLKVDGRGRERARRRLQRHVARDDRRKGRGRRRRKREHGQESDDETHGRTLRQGAWSTLQVARDHLLP